MIGITAALPWDSILYALHLALHDLQKCRYSPRF